MAAAAAQAGAGEVIDAALIARVENDVQNMRRTLAALIQLVRKHEDAAE